MGRLDHSGTRHTTLHHHRQSTQGRETQRVDIVPDMEVHPTAEGLEARQDELRDKAMQVITTKQ